MSDSVGPMMNMVRNNARPASTWFGGTVVKPSALRVIPSTTKIFVKDVQSSSRAGATESRVSASRIVSELLGFTVVPSMSTLTVGAAGAPAGRGGAGAASTSAAGAAGGAAGAAAAAAAPPKI